MQDDGVDRVFLVVDYLGFSVDEEVSADSSPGFGVQSVELHGDEAEERSGGVLAMEMEVEASGRIDDFEIRAGFCTGKVNDSTTVGGEELIVSLDEELVSLESERHIGMAGAPDTDDVNTVLGSIVERLGFQSTTEATAAKEIEERATEVHAERDSVVPLGDSCPVGLGWNSLRLRFAARQTPRWVHCDRNVGGQDRVNGALVVVIVESKLGALSNAMDSTGIDTKLVLVVLFDGHETTIRYKGDSTEEETLLVRSNDGGFVSFHGLLDEIEKLVVH